MEGLAKAFRSRLRSLFEQDLVREAKTSQKYTKPCLEVDQGLETRKLKVIGFQSAQYDGPINIQVQVGKNSKNISNAVPLTFARVTQRLAFWSSLVVFLAIMVAVFLIVRKGVGSTTIKGKRYSAFRSFFLDKETNSYSLSKFQLLLWTSVFVFGYLYLFLCRMLIQWKFELPPIPDGLPGMLAISAGTAVVAAGATEARGSKGARRHLPVGSRLYRYWRHGRGRAFPVLRVDACRCIRFLGVAPGA